MNRSEFFLQPAVFGPKKAREILRSAQDEIENRQSIQRY